MDSINSTEYKKQPVTAAVVTSGVNTIPPKMVRVIAPSTLPPNYSLQVQTKDGYNFTAVTPIQGVKAGEIFVTPEPEGFSGEPLLEVPRGRWRDGLFDFCNYGPCHTSLWCSLLCREIHMGQVMQRMRLDWCGQRTTGTITAFRTVMTLAICYAIFDTSLDGLVSNQDEDFYGPLNMVKDGVATIYSVYTIYALYQTRKKIREEYSIPEERCHGCEDCVCALCCSCCTVAQISRHTGDYDKNPSVYCSATGLPDHLPYAAADVV